MCSQRFWFRLLGHRHGKAGNAKTPTKRLGSCGMGLGFTVHRDLEVLGLLLP